MAIIEQVYNLDLVPSGAPLVVNVSQYDVRGRKLTFNLFKDNVAFAPPASTSSYLIGTKKDGTGFYYQMQTEGTSVSIEVTDQMTVFDGDVVCEVRIADALGEKLGSANFILRVEKSALDDETAISESDLPVFEELVNQATDAAARTEALFPEGGSPGQVLTKTAEGTEWGDGGHGDVATVDGFSPDANGAVTTERVLTQAQYNALSEAEKNNGMTYFITDGSGSGESFQTWAYATTLGNASAISDGTFYSGGYKLTINSSSITVNSSAVIFFLNGDYSGNVTWITAVGKITLYFDQNPNGKAIRVEWKTLTNTSATIS